MLEMSGLAQGYVMMLRCWDLHSETVAYEQELAWYHWIEEEDW